MQASRVFSPAAPIRERDVFAGRTDQLRMVVDAINQPGQHALIYGERGVGKTSLANVLADFVRSTGQPGLIAPHINCEAGDNFSSVWRKVFSQISFDQEVEGMGYRPEVRREAVAIDGGLPDPLTPDAVLAVCRKFPPDHLFIPVLDEFDRLRDELAVQQFTDVVKSFSDYLARTTLVLVGVADSVEELVGEHESVERALVQVRMPRMSPDELAQIVNHGTAALGMSADDDATRFVGALSQGLPHYTHLLGLHAVRQAIDAGTERVTRGHVGGAIGKAITGSQQTLQRAHHRATMSPRSDALYRQVLLASALARTDGLGYFAAADVREPMSRIMGRKYEIASFSRHLADFCEDDRGPVLERTGVPRRYRFRFRNPLLQPFTIMAGLEDGLIKPDDLDESRTHPS